MNDNVRRVIEADKLRNRPKRFYKDVGVEGEHGQFAVVLDGRRIKTPMKAELSMPSRDLAEAVAGEWHDQGEYIDPASMRLTRLCNTAIDRVAGDRERIISELVGFVASDLLCYRAEQPETLVERQNAAWDPLLQFAAKHLGARFVCVAGIMHQEQPAPALQAIKDHLSGFDAYELTAVHNMTTLTGSCIIATAVHAGEISPDDGWGAAHVDEDWQIEQWGEDAEAQARRAVNRCDYDASFRLLELSKRQVAQ